MAALAGVNGGSPQEPVNDALTQAEPMAPEPAEAEPEAAEPMAPEATEAEPEAAEAEAGLAEEGVAEAQATGTAAAEGEVTGAAEIEPAGKPARDVSPLAIAGVVLGVIVLVGLAAGVLNLATHGFHRKTVVIYRPAAVFALRPGDCVDSAPNGLVFTRLACSQPHDSEVFASFALTGSSWPGSRAVEQNAGDGCAARLSGYLNPQLANAAFAQEYVYPGQSAWKAGERTVVCEIRSSTGKLSGSVRKVS